ncbi:rRNA maturation RNase YbeY [Parasphingorhabdus cellanae]|uniref:Endoribonuclease YbeY n=1 Tax=Parasphingorhabdus cellanae TaxID=2806553 RepID=A0ABX7T6U2_9SPHN|nr:rRNA maturation RNase YbeY [Parasphingorhabdus cellanae]QTD56570.1 rRNA maturation RNase YbeY [Parasphingorhabdus cellanae]
MLRIELNKGANWSDEIDWQERSEKASTAALSVSSYGQLAQQNFALEISVKLSDNDEVQQLNAAYRGKDKPTNVLSFPLVPHDLLQSLSNSDDGEVLLGDIIMAHDVCAQEADEKSITMADYMSHLLVHGVLHLLGYDHETEADALIMEALEVRALQNLSIANPYIDRHTE